MYHIHILQIKGFILAGDQVHGITLKNQISRFRTLKVRPVGGAAVSEKTSQWHGFTTQKKGDNSYTADKTQKLALYIGHQFSGHIYPLMLEKNTCF
jgi:hypothetical protein